MKKLIVLLLFGMLFSSCGASYLVKYSLKNPSKSKELVFSDDLIDIEFSIDRIEFSFSLKNKSKNTLKINWDEISFIDISGNSKRVIHSGVRLVNRNEPQAASTIPSNAKITDILIPSENIYYTSGKYGGWNYLSLVYVKDLESTNSLLGKTVSLYFPIYSGETKKEYNFVFKVDDITKK